MTRKERVYESIVTYIAEHGYPPSLQDIADGAGLESRSSPLPYLDELEAEGRIERDPAVVRGLRLVEMAAS